MQPAFSSRTNRRGTTVPAPALRLLFVMVSDMWHLCCDLTRTRSALDRDCAANTCRDIEWDDRRWNGCASSSPPHSAAHPGCALAHFARDGYLFRPMPSDRGALQHASHARLVRTASSVPLVCRRGIERTNMQVAARPDKRRNFRAG